MRTLLTLCSIVIACVVSAMPGGGNDSTLLAKADTLRVNGKCKEALRIYTDLIDRHAQEVRALVGRASCTRDPDACFADLQRAFALAPNDPHAHYLRASIYEAMNMYDRAILDLDDAIAHAPDTTFMRKFMNQRAWCKLNVRDLSGALAETDQLLVLDSTDRVAVNTRAVVLEELGRIDEALAEMRHFIRLDPEATEGYLNTAYFLAKHGRYQEALDYYDQMEPRSKDDAFFFNNRGYARMKNGDLKGALKDIKRSIEMRPSNAYAYRNLGLTYQAMDRKEDACTAFEKALSMGFTGQFGDEVEKVHATYCR